MKIIKHNGEAIKWRYLEALHNIQLTDDLHLANKVTGKHIDYVKSKMNVRLAAQTLSNSVADAIDFLREEEGHPDFQGSEKTTEFIRKLDTLFDMCNSKNPIARYSKARIDESNLEQKIEQFHNLSNHLKELTDVEGQLLVLGRRKKPFLGFMMTAMSLCQISRELLKRPNEPLKYLLTIRFSQDHLETLFSRLHRKGGWNKNPNVLQLKWSLRSLLMKNGVTASSCANSVEIDDTSYIVRKKLAPFKRSIKTNNSLHTADSKSINIPQQSIILYCWIHLPQDLQSDQMYPLRYKTVHTCIRNAKPGRKFKCFFCTPQKQRRTGCIQ
ncbi:THAP domain-containing protein 9 [Plakobranchus ocellatus]|uniref:THAP domain-containing protein 9 n=1 Tax=Plakobranchus ocellatus TaxID=259542 RepID=A0AAV4CJA7_9GAST|nr:THAP domain-containing protein 9 [Plakobranchus ocellatus]